MQREFVTVRDRKLSLWQSAVHKVTTSPSRNVDQTAGRLMRIGAAIHVKAAEKDIAVEEPPLRVDGTLDVQHYAFLSQVYFEHAQARIDSGDLAVESPPWKYSDKDPNFIIECSEQYLEYYIIGGHAPVYHDWQTTGKNNINYSVIPYKLPADAKVLLIGDWGTGQSDAVTMLRVAIKTLKPTAILHLGDIYYSGTADECKAHFVDVFKAVFSDPDTPRVPIFTIPGNHEYYSGGQGFYTTIAEINVDLPTGPNGKDYYLQPASYFCLRTEDDRWQFLAMDTGIGDHDPATAIDPFKLGPVLQPSEVSWHHDKLSNFAGNTILLSHHQLYSANASINGSLTSAPANINEFLLGTFRPYFNTVSAWYWGHEHNFVGYKNGIFGLTMGRLLGSSAFEETLDNDPYKINYTNAPYADNLVQLDLSPYSDTTKYYNHSLGLIDFKRDSPGDALKVSYYQYPSWGTNEPPTAPPPPTSLQFMYTEEIGNPAPVRDPIWTGNLAISTPNGEPASIAGPSLALFRNRIYMAYRGANLTDIYLAWYDGNTWQGNVKISSMTGGISPKTTATPALAAFRDKLYMVYKGESSTMYVAWFDGTKWFGNVKISSQSGGISPKTSLGVAAAVYNDRLYIAYRGSSSSTLYYAWFDGAKWGGNDPVKVNGKSAETATTPALTVYTARGVAPVLCAAYPGSTTGNLYFSTFNGSSWSGNQTISVQDGPGKGTPATHGGIGMAQVGNDLVLLYNGTVRDDIYTVKLSGNAWSGNQMLKDTSDIKPQTGHQPAVVSYIGGLYTTYAGLSGTLYQAELVV